MLQGCYATCHTLYGTTTLLARLLKCQRRRRRKSAPPCSSANALSSQAVDTWPVLATTPSCLQAREVQDVVGGLDVPAAATVGKVTAGTFAGAACVIKKSSRTVKRSVTAMAVTMDERPATTYLLLYLNDQVGR